MEEKLLNETEEKKSGSFIEQMVKEDLAAGKNGGRIQTRFPPEPNASRRSLGRISVPMCPFTLLGRVTIVALVGRYLTN